MTYHYRYHHNFFCYKGKRISVSFKIIPSYPIPFLLYTIDLLRLGISRCSRVESSQERSNHLLQFLFRLLIDFALSSNGLQQLLLGGLQVLEELGLKGDDLGGVHFVQMSTHASEDDGHLFLNGHGHCGT